MKSVEVLLDQMVMNPTKNEITQSMSGFAHPNSPQQKRIFDGYQVLLGLEIHGFAFVQ